jgi:DNA-binding NarL/FixJ family response regulator
MLMGPKPEPITAVVVDHKEMVRAAFVLLLQREGINVVGTASNGP